MKYFDDHTTEIDGIPFHAQEFSSEVFVPQKEIEPILIQNGKPRYYPSGLKLRNAQFTVWMEGDGLKIQSILKKLHNKVCKFVSIHIGSFNAWVNTQVTVEDGVPGLYRVSFTIQEV